MKGTTDPLGYYAPKTKISASYEMPRLLGETDQKIILDLAFLLTDYNKDPSHEPGGIIEAARLYPTLSFRIPEVRHKTKNLEYRRATAVQVLYRLNFRLDDRGSGNQCGIFADLEDLTLPGGSPMRRRTTFALDRSRSFRPRSRCCSMWSAAFPHGIFFPHTALDDLSFKNRSKIKLIPGGTGAQFLPDTPKQKWRR